MPEEKMKTLQEWFVPLTKEDIKEKITLNLKDMNIFELKNNLYKELSLRNRKVLAIEHDLIYQKIQIENLKEQLIVVEAQIMEK